MSILHKIHQLHVPLLVTTFYSRIEYVSLSKLKPCLILICSNLGCDEGLDLGAKSSADLSTLFDIGGIVGGILAGFISDVTSASAITCAAAFLLSFPMVSILTG